MRITKTFALAMATAGALALSSGAMASAVTTFDADLANPANSGSDPNFYNGSGNPNGGFVVTNDNGIELGLRAKHRQDPNTLDPIGTSGNAGHIYNVQTGFQAPGRAWWNYEFSIDLQPNGVGSLTLNDINAQLKIIDNTQNQSITIDPLTYWSDNSTWGPSGEGTLNAVNKLTDWGLQNSENPSFGDFPLASLYDESANDFLTFILTVTDKAGNVLATDWMGVQVGNADIPTSPTPEPVTLSLVGAGLAGMGFMAKRRKKAAS